MDVTIGKTSLRAVSMRRGRIAWAAEATYQDASDLARVLAALAAERPRGLRRAAVTLTADLARVKTLNGLPPLGRADLAAHVRLRSRRYFLQNGVPFVTDAMPLAGSQSLGGSRAAQLAGAPLPIIESILEGLTAAGLECDDIVPADTDLSLVPDGARNLRRVVLRRSVLRWAGISAAAFALAGTSWIVSEARAERGAIRELASIKPALDDALMVQRDLDAATDALGVMTAAQSGKASRSRFLAGLTRALPDSVFLVGLRLEGDGTGSLSGYAPQAAAVVARLERGGIVRSPSLEGPTTREVIGGRALERFAIRFRLPPAPEQMPR